LITLLEAREHSFHEKKNVTNVEDIHLASLWPLVQKESDVLRLFSMVELVKVFSRYKRLFHKIVEALATITANN
jgi:hypothetical protein